MTTEQHPGTRDSVKRSLLKTISWRACATTTTMLIVYIVTGKAMISLSVGVADIIIKTILYYIHERVWSTELPEVGER